MRSHKLTGSSLPALAVAALSPAVAWLLWVARTEGKPSDALHVAWFATVGLGCVVAGGLTRKRSSLPLVAAMATLSAILGLWFWWSSEDETGLFVIGIALAAPLVAVASFPLALAGHLLAGHAPSRSTPDDPQEGESGAFRAARW